ncbi:MAG: hydantoinase B/oxoprolinase family protein [Anaerolineae bacterium]
MRFFVASRAHHADVGGMSPGSLPLSTELYQEEDCSAAGQAGGGGQAQRCAAQTDYRQQPRAGGTSR